MELGTGCGLRPECWHQGWAGGRGQLSPGEPMGDAGWGDPIRATPRGTEQLRVRWRWTPQPSAADKLQLQAEHGEDPRGAEGLGRAMGGAGGWDEGVTEPPGLRSSNRTWDAASEDAQGLGLIQGDTLFPAQMLWPWDTPRPHAQLPGIQRVWPGAAGAGEVGLRAQR